VTSPAGMTENGPILESYRHELMLTGLDLWLAYFALGGTADFAELTEYLGGSANLSVHEHNTLTLALNEAFFDIGADHPLPYL
jgi:hypothetical protein